jgi:periplasmic divalent cation tolerance protein
MITIVETTLLSKEEAEEFAKTVVKSKLAACCHIIPISSCYEWEGNITLDTEVLLRMKTLDTLLPQLLSFLEETHPYDTPEILSYKTEQTSKKYLSWVTSVLNPQESM